MIWIFGLVLIWCLRRWMKIPYFKVIGVDIDRATLPTELQNSLVVSSSQLTVLPQPDLNEAVDVYESAGMSAGFCLFRIWYWFRGVPFEANVLVKCNKGTFACKKVVVKNRREFSTTVQPYLLLVEGPLEPIS